MKKVYDCFTFNDELDLLEIRLNTLNDVVDYFVIIESLKSWQNKSKPLFYLDNKDKFSSFKDKIIHIVIPENEFIDHTWTNESLSFNKILEAVKSAHEEDLICVSAIDEIPNPTILKNLKDTLTSLVHLEQNFYYYYLNTRFQNNGSTKWVGTCVTPYKYLLNINNLYELAILQRGHHQVVPDAGWHFSFLGGVNLIYNKLQSYSHNEFNNITPNEIESRLKNLSDPLNRSNVIFYSKDSIETLPIYIQQNINKYYNLILT